ncbi:uncharacterized protein LOC134664059 [Cydia fagiglandana]|uniref:uncharacterized protein LOC134664059 n=1 Tax=Cydia fagiglandana TaxID=1458189 RepID=UPI002FEE5013
MLSRRDKLYVQPWEERRFQDHRSKVRSALPAIDDRPPPPRAHVAVKLKKYQREADRARKIEQDNYSLLQRLSSIMKTKRLDNCWETPLPNFRHKVGKFYEEDALSGRVAARACSQVSEDSSYSGNVKCFACYHKRKTVLQLNKVYGKRSSSSTLPSI